MDPNAALRMIGEADRVDADTREVMQGLHEWLSRGGFAPNWSQYPTGTRRYRKAYGGAKSSSRSSARSSARSSSRSSPRSSRTHAVKQDAHPVVKLKDRDSRNYVWLTIRDGVVVGAMGSDPRRYMGMTLEQAKHLARHGGKSKVREGHATRSHATARAFSADVTMPGIGAISRRGLQIGDIVQRADASGGKAPNRYVVIEIRGPWILTRRISGTGTPGIIQFPSASMLKKVS